MEPENLSKCNNCGAQLPEHADADLRCAYCGSVYETAAKAANKTPASIDHNIPVNPAKPSNSAGGYVIGILLLLFVVIGGGLIIKSGGAAETSNYADSLTTDTAVVQPPTDVKNDESDTSPVKATLKALSGISIDSSTFKKLYRKARKKTDHFSGNTEISDQSSPQYVNHNGFYIYITKEAGEFELRFSAQYVADDWLFINELTINADGSNSTLSPEFKRDNADGSIWEWCDTAVPDEDIPMLVRIASAKKVRVKYSGDKYYKVVRVTAGQQAAIKKELQLYKGLLLGYK